MALENDRYWSDVEATVAKLSDELLEMLGSGEADFW